MGEVSARALASVRTLANAATILLEGDIRNLGRSVMRCVTDGFVLSLEGNEGSDICHYTHIYTFQLKIVQLQITSDSIMEP